VNVPAGLTSLTGVNSAFSTASHRARGDGCRSRCGVTIAVADATSVCTLTTPGTVYSFRAIRFAQFAQCMSPTYIVDGLVDCSGAAVATAVAKNRKIATRVTIEDIRFMLISKG
jgi:hypothetical protein